MPGPLLTVAAPAAPGGALVLAFLLALCRIGPLLVGIPFGGFWGRLGLLCGGSGLLTPLLLPMAYARLSPPLSLQLALLLLHELGVGMLLLLGALLPWALLRGAGQLLELPAGIATEDDGPIGRLCGFAALCLFFALGGGPMTVTALAGSYSLAPLPELGKEAGGALAAAAVSAAAKLLPLIARLISLSLALALPILCARLIAGLGISLVLRGLDGSPGRTRLLGTAPSGLYVLVELVTLFAGFLALLFAWGAHFRTLLF